MLPCGSLGHFPRFNGYFFLVLNFLVFCFCLLTSANAASSQSPKVAFATEDLQEEYQLLKEETVISAAQYEQPISQASSNIYVITAEDIRQAGALFLPNLLRRIPGMEIMQMTGEEFNVSARGNNQERANKFLLLVDGRSHYLDIQAIPEWSRIPVTFSEIKKIEVLKGPASAVYGFNAFDGVVNIITKSPQEMNGTTVDLVGGEFNTFRSSATQAGKVKEIAYRISGEYQQNGQWRNRSQLAFRNTKFNVYTEYHLQRNGKLFLEGGVRDNTRDDFASGEILRFDGDSFYSYTRVGYEQENFFVRAYWYRTDGELDNITRPGLAPFITVTDSLGRSRSTPLATNSYNLLSQYTFKLGTQHKVSAGLNYRRNDASKGFIVGFKTEDRFGAYAQDEWEIGEKFRLASGVRLDLHSNINPTYSPRIALFYYPHPDHSFRISGSVAYRPPTLIETNQVINTVTVGLGPTVTNTLTGSNDLIPEQIISYEIEYQGWLFGHRLRPRVSLFYNQLSDLITTITLSPTASAYVNRSGADIYGIEAGVEALATPWLSGFANVSYQQIDQTFTGMLTRGAPQWKVNAGLLGKWNNGFHGQLLLHHVGSAVYPVSSTYSTFAGFFLIPASAVPNPKVESYTLINLRGGYSFWQDRAEIAVSVSNALNDRHREHPLGDIIGSRILGWLTIHLGQ